jgi:hypothetical protein
MFGLFKSPPYHDSVLGGFVRARGCWRGSLAIDGKALPLALSGTRKAPDAQALAIAKRLPVVWSSRREQVALALAEHREADPHGGAGDVWGEVELLSAAIMPLGGELRAEIALAAAWDEEHLLGARFEGDAFVELNGSIVPA